MTVVAAERRAARSSNGPDARARKCRRKFLRIFPGGFQDATYIDWERAYKWQAHLRWREALARPQFESLLEQGEFESIARHAITIESRTNLLFSFEKMALRDAVRTRDGARVFAQGLYALLYGEGSIDSRFDAWVGTVASLPRRQTRVLTWPIVTIFPFIAEPRVHFYVKPTVTRVGAEAYGFSFAYRPTPNWSTYASALEFSATVRRDLRDLRPRDQIDLQSFIWVQGSDEYD
jgi:hypothetical protein